MSLAIDDLLPPPPQPLDFVQKRQNGIAIHGDEILGILPSLDALDAVPCAARPVRHPQGIRTAVSSQADHLIRPRRRRLGDTAQLGEAFRSQACHHASPRTLASTATIWSHSLSENPKSPGSNLERIHNAVSNASTISRTTPASRASVGMPSHAFQVAAMRRAL